MDPTLGRAEQTTGDVPVVAVSGELDLASVPGLRGRLEAHLDAGRSMIVVDLRAVTFLDSTALGVLVGVLKRCRELGGDLRLVITEPRILKLFRITGLQEAFSISPFVDTERSGGSAEGARREEGPT
jgi:anti-sigma B factor antagonist